MGFRGGREGSTEEAMAGCGLWVAVGVVRGNEV